MKKLFFYCVIVFFITSCASFKYSKNYENTFNLTSNVDHVIVSNKSGNLRANKTSSSYQNHNYEIYLDKINNKYLSLQVTKNNYDTAYLKLKKTPRFGAIARDFFIGIPTFFTPFLIDAFRSDFYQISSNSKHQEVKLKYHQEFMKKEFKKIENSASPSDFVDYISNYPHSNFVNQATDKKDASELVIAINKASESEIDNYILSHQNSSSLNEAKKIKAEIVEARIAFQEATNLNSVSAYEQFLAKYPKSIPHKEAHIKLIDAAEKAALSSNNLKQMLAYYDNYLLKFKNFIGEETYKSKNAIISKTIDNQIVLENNPKQLWNYNEYSKLWITYIDVSTKYKNKLLTLDISKAYDLKISSELFALLIKISDANKHAEFLEKASIDFPELSNTKDLILITILQKSSNKNGNLKLFNQAYVPYLISKNKLYDVTSFNYKNNQYQSIEGSTYEELTFKNNEIQEIKVFKDNNLQTQLKFSSGYSYMNEALDVTIGKQTWTTKNLDVSTYRNGDAIPQVQDNAAWADLTTGAWCYYENKPANGTKYGKLYNWYAVNDPRGLAPKGYHIPGDKEWTNLTDYLGGDSLAGLKMRSGRGWENNSNGTNSIGFAGLPSGSREVLGDFYGVGAQTFWWSSSEHIVKTSDPFFGAAAWCRFIWSDNGGNVTSDHSFKTLGMSVRCLRDGGSDNKPEDGSTTATSVAEGETTAKLVDEASYFINGKLVLTDFMQFSSKLYSYEFEDGVNLSLKQLENKIKEGDAAVVSKNFDLALKIYSECSNDYPPSIELNKRLENSINNAENKQNIYLQKIEKERLAQEKKRLAIFMAELAERLKKYEESRRDKKSRERGDYQEVSNTGSSKCTTCNRKFKFHRWIETGAGGWENVEDTKYGWIKCSTCTGYGVTMDFDSFNQVPRSERCYMSCNNGWEKCRDSSHRNE